MPPVTIVPMDNSDIDYNTDEDSADEALSEILGFPSLKHIDFSREEHHRLPGTIDELYEQMPMESIEALVEQRNLRDIYFDTSVCILPEELAIPSAIMRQLADEAVLWSAPNSEKQLNGVQRTYETITSKKSPGGPIVTRRELTRLENLRGHDGWRTCEAYIENCISSLLKQQMILYKTKFNLKPPGGAGFAPHVDTPSLRLPFPALLAEEKFVTVMIAIDDMTVQNGCLRVSKRPLTDPPVQVVPHRIDGNPDGDGRAGALVDGEHYSYEDIVCKGGTVVAFDGWVPHRSGPNRSALGRRAVFLTYHAASTGDLHDLYYEKMQQMRNSFLDEKRRDQQHEVVVTSQADDQGTTKLASLPT